MKKLFLLLLSFSLLAACSQNTDKKEFELKAQPAVTHKPEQSTTSMKVTKPVELLPDFLKSQFFLPLMFLHLLR